ncbi:MAG: LysE family transporter [Deltaproteobacteria bacterium]|nr:LysE family transporter [Deltaproteobacteria bacterium]MBI4373659.1 LysE family transporter [Deltaproteobacteria bacterium]
MILYFKSLFLGFLVALPVGPIAILILQRSLQVGPLAGIASGIGAAVADGLIAFLAGLGLAALLEEIGRSQHFFVGGIGGLVLVLVGLKLFFQKPPALRTEEVLSERYLHHYLWDTLSVFLLTLTNPMTIIAFAALFAGSNLIPLDPRKIDYLRICLGVFSGSFLWWVLLVLLSRPIKRNISPLRIHRLLEIVGVILILLGGLSSFPRLGSLVDKIPFLNKIL